MLSCHSKSELANRFVQTTSSVVHPSYLLCPSPHRRPRQPHPKPIRTILPGHRPCVVRHPTLSQGTIRYPADYMLEVLEYLDVRFLRCGMSVRSGTRAWIWRLTPSDVRCQVVFGVIVTRGPRSHLAASAMTELEEAVDLFSQAAQLNRRAAKAHVRLRD